ncbi:aldo/keto reductase [Alteromonas sp. ASW11-36]|uniref:Aldo/keto reductase n=1 Tax=Alteromonas arenosi TaxID=3055817 RepID=A0ABT7T1M3_9ALTE|nr:aldo/keto reductase [Alteromonas sp. ASW11-36]MDM7862338.1 aldo/keto reductase [Alteromonas sp. ASW11-36]
MRFNPLGSSGLTVSEICLGSMTWGIQNNQHDADQQIQRAIDTQINFIDTAEMYPVPPNKETYGDTERVIGDWLSRHPAQRQALIIMSKIAGPGIGYIRGGERMTGKALPVALDASLERLQTDYVDVYQLHWANRPTAHFGTHWPNQVRPSKIDADRERDTMRELVIALGEEIKAGKIRHWGLSDETPWGIHTFLQLCSELNVPRPVSIQNEFSLIHLKDWPYLIETCVLEDVAYLPWSPLAGGALSGKYLNGERPAGSRWTMVQRQGLFRDTAMANQAIARYVALANDFGITPSQLALAWCRQVDGVTSTIIGATTLAQLEENIAAFSITLTDQQLAEVHEVLQQFSQPF